MARSNTTSTFSRLQADSSTSAVFAADRPTRAQARQICFVDAGVEAPSAILAGLPAQTQCVMLSSDADGVAQMAAVLAHAGELQAIHIISHGGPGEIVLAGRVIDAKALTEQGAQWALIGQSLAETGTLVLYGCEVGRGHVGGAFVEQLADLSGVDVAASSQVNGLLRPFTADVQVGLLKAQAVDLSGYAGQLAVILGTSANDNLLGTAGADNIQGFGGADTITGGAGGDSIDGGSGADTITGGAGDDNLDGGAGADTITGNAGNDVLDGGAGVDSLSGGAGDDTYIVDAAGDVVIEAAGQGNDTVVASVDYTLGGSNVENLTLISPGTINGIGNALDNVLTGDIGDNGLDGRAGDDNLNGGDGQDTLLGREGKDDLTGDVGNDVLDGGFDNDGLSGGEGADILLGREGDDVLKGGVDDDFLDGGAGGDRLSGGEGADIVLGGEGDDVLDGGAGNDYLEGGDGGDTFVFDTALNALTNVDLIRDFSSADDQFELDASVFTALGLVVSAGELQLGTVALDPNDYLIYDSTTGTLSYDADANGAGAAVQFAELAIGTAITAGDFVMA